ncbi:competence type IV pilus minor pilin ComGG [Halalkalibacter kiskunsagensis]|uniref:Competence type IV pilus minor pilin ComGG n=1 Tax=Halalkalibacter kiskunsagensis TaxID=1548599 RepID=A0ABV6KCD6_9BACI
MVREERGFIYPVTMIICLLMVPIVLHQMNLYMKEKRFLYEQERLLQLETLLQVGMKEFLKNEHEPQLNESILYSYGFDIVTFTVKDYKDGVSFISVKVQLESGHERIAGFYYNWTNSTVNYYWEVSDSISFIFSKEKELTKIAANS